MVNYSSLLTLALCLGLVHGRKRSLSERQNGKPNVVVIMSDDQDLQLDSLSVQPQIQSLIGGEGITYNNHYCTTAWCCPSRVSFLTGKAAHNTNVTAIAPPYGGWPKFLEQGLNDNYLPIWLSNAGINTYYVGKFMNYYRQDNYDAPYPAGWTDSSFLVDPWTYNYFHSRWTSQSPASIASEAGTHTTTVTHRKALDMLDAAVDAGGQFFLMVAPVAPHLQIGGGSQIPPAQPKYAGAFSTRAVPRSGNFNPDVPSGASWVHELPQLSDAQIALGDAIYVGRLENLAGIDDMVASLIGRLDDHGILDNTYVIYTTDNGFHIGNHRLPAGKRCPYEEDINIPFLVRGPGVAQGVSSNDVHSHEDVAPTIMKMLGLPQQGDFDGQPIDYATAAGKQEYVSVEFWTGSGNPNGVANGRYYNNTYKALRLISDDQNLLYSVWCTGEHELYDMDSDPDQMDNLLAGGATPHGAQKKLVDRLDALLMVTKSCAQDTCRAPWAVLFPDGSVNSLADAMDSKYDSFFSSQPKIAYSSCDLGYIIADEGPQDVIPYGQGHSRRRVHSDFDFNFNF